MNPRRFYTALGFIACHVDTGKNHAMDPRRVYTPLGFVVSPLD